MHAIYVAERSGRTYVSTSALALARHLRAAPSLLGIAGFLRSGYQFGAATAWTGVSRLEPGTVLRCAETGVHLETYWRH